MASLIFGAIRKNKDEEKNTKEKENNYTTVKN
jgi:hypothetical protein